ncbi:MAG TPA: DUF1572 family protein [Methylomirabilota bacterium]
MTEEFIAALRQEFAGLRSLAERAVGQVDDRAFHEAPGADENSIAVLMQHVGGNLRSRWTEFRTTDGEKPDRHRDTEFEAGPDRQAVTARWRAGWAALQASLDSLRADDLERTIYIRAQPVTVTAALLRSLAHTAGHVYQIVQLARHWQGGAWQTLSIPRGDSAEFTRNLASRTGAPL